MLEPEGKPELELDLVLPEKDWPELKLAPGQVSMLGPRLSSTLEHVKRWEPTTEGDQVSEMKTGTELWPNLESRLMLMGKHQMVPRMEVRSRWDNRCQWWSHTGQQSWARSGNRQGG